MKRTLLAILFLSIGCKTSFAQVYPYNENFDGMTPAMPPTGWIHTTPGFQVYAVHGVNSSQALSRQLTNFSMQDSVISPLIGPITSTSIMFFSYRIVDYIGGTPLSHLLLFGDKLEVEISNGGAFLTNLTIDNLNHLPDTGFVTKSVALDTYIGTSIVIMFKGTSLNDDFFIDIDNVSVVEPMGIHQLSHTNETAHVYPNPVKEGAFLSANNMVTGNYKMIVTNTAGKTVLQNEIALDPTSSLLNTHDLTEGMYMLSLQNEKNNYHLKFTVNK